MKKILLALLVVCDCLIFAAVSVSLRHDFTAEFDRLFLSTQPICYEDNTNFLGAIPRQGLAGNERELVREKLRQFLRENKLQRQYAPGCHLTSVASPLAFFRLSAVQILAEIGYKKDAGFIAALKSLPMEQHPLFDTECRRAIRKLMNR